MILSYSQYLYFDGETENPFTSAEHRERRMDIFWFYERQHFNASKLDPNIYTVKSYIKNILVHSLDEDKPELPHYQMYLSNSPKNKPELGF